MNRPILLAAALMMACSTAAPVSLGSADPCAGIEDPGQVFSGEGLDDFDVSGDEVYVSARPIPDIVQSTLYRASLHGGPLIEVSTVRSATNIAVTRSDIFFEERAQGGGGTTPACVLFRLPKSGGAPVHVPLPSELSGFDAWSGLGFASGLRADALDNVLAIRSFGNDLDMVIARADGFSARIGAPLFPIWSTGVSDAAEVTTVALSGTEASVVSISLNPLGPPRVRYVVPEGGSGGIAEDEGSVYLSRPGAIARISKKGGPTTSLVLDRAVLMTTLAVGGRFLYGGLRGPESKTPTQFGRASLDDGHVETLAEERPVKILASGCYVFWSTRDKVYGRRR